MRISIFIISIFLLLGCSGNLVEMKYSSSLKPYYNFNVNAPLVVAVKKGDVLSASYVPFIIEILQKRGFNSVYTENQLPINNARNVVYISLMKMTKGIPNSSISYVPSVVPDNDSCMQYDGIYYCRQKVAPIITNYTASIKLESAYHFVMDWYDLPTKSRILYIDGSIAEGPCIFEGIYKDLIYQTISRIDFDRPEVYSYNSQLSYQSFNCMLGQTKSLIVKK